MYLLLPGAENRGRWGLGRERFWLAVLKYDYESSLRLCPHPDGQSERLCTPEAALPQAPLLAIRLRVQIRIAVTGEAAGPPDVP